MLSVALVTAVATMYSSCIKSLINFETYQKGNFHVAFFDVPINEVETIKNNRGVDDVYLTKNEVTKEVLNLLYSYSEPSGEATTGTITIELNSSTVVTLTYDPTADTFRISDDVTYNGTTYYLGPTTLSLIA